MTPREQRLLIIVGGFFGLILMVGMGYLFIGQPLLEKYDREAALEDEVLDKENQLIRARGKIPQLNTALRQSLPNTPYAAQEYEAILTQKLQELGVASGRIDVRFNTSSVDPAPELAKDKPAYITVGLTYTLNGISYETLIDFLRAYYSLDLLHRITSLKITKATNSDKVPTTSSVLKDKPDLTVQLTTEGIILEGAEERRSLLPIPVAFAAISGNSGWQTLRQDPEVARGIVPLNFSKVLAAMGRNYDLLLVKDIFHGSPPPPPIVRVEPPPPPLEDVSPYIRLVGIGGESDGAVRAYVEDFASNTGYKIAAIPTSDGLKIKVTRSWFLSGRERIDESERGPDMLEIEAEKSRTVRIFRVLELDLKKQAMLLLERAHAPEQPTRGGFGRREREPRMRTDPEAMLVGGIFTAVPPEKLYRWSVGESLASLREIRGEERETILSRIYGLDIPGNDQTVIVEKPKLE